MPTSTATGITRYRYLDIEASPPTFWFGYGLSYTTFAYSNLAVNVSRSGSSSQTRDY